ncbi:MAG: CAP domain-containing protein [Actinomycetota bacterium]
MEDRRQQQRGPRPGRAGFRRAISLLLTAALLCALTTVGAGRAAASAADETQFLQLVNQLRTSKGLPPLVTHPELTAGARSWTDQMATSGTLAHSPNMSSGLTVKWSVLGENVGMHGAHKIDELFQAFVSSPAHYGNLVDDRFNYIGIGVTTGSDGTLWTTHRFMAAPVTAPPTTTPTPTPTPTAPPTTVPATTVPPTSPTTAAAPKTAPATDPISNPVPETTPSVPDAAPTPTTPQPTTGAPNDGPTTTTPKSAPTTGVPSTAGPTPTNPETITGGGTGETTGSDTEDNTGSDGPLTVPPAGPPTDPTVVDDPTAGPSVPDVPTVEQVLVELAEAGI